MSDAIKHECGFALLRLRKPLEYYTTRYGTWMYGLNKLYLLMEKQHNRGQDGAGFATIKINPKPGKPYIDRLRSNSKQPLFDIFEQLHHTFDSIKQQNRERFHDPFWAKENVPFAGELLLGHLRYGTFGKNDIEFVHPVLRENNWKTRNLVLAGNFNLTNVQELFKHLIDLGQHPKAYTDTVTILEKIGHFLDDEVEKLFRKYKDLGLPNAEITERISNEIDIVRILNNATWRWDGGFAIAGMIGTGDAFVLRDPNGIRPAYYYYNDEIAVVTSERPVIQTVFNAPFKEIKELEPGHAIIIKQHNEISVQRVIEPYKKKSCSFERIYFSRGTDRDIYMERKKLGKLIAPKVLEKINYDIKNTIFSYIPNTAADAFYGLIEEINLYCNEIKKQKVLQLGQSITSEKLDEFIYLCHRIEKLAVKDL
ncbi:MAG: amidophosphoribosyltransferase, partial [Bacteroidales bacterium]